MNTHKSSFAIGNLWCPVWSLTILALLFVLLLPGSAVAQSVGIDPQAEKQLKATLDYLSGLEQFSVETHNTIEGVLDYGQKVQFDFHASITLQRPGKLLAERHGDIVDQAWYYDGTTLTLHDTASNYYARVQVPGNINEMLDLARESLGLMAPASDLLYRNVFPLMMQNVYLATDVGTTNIGGVRCNHFAFSRPEVDFQIWVPETGAPLPCKYVVTDKLAYGQPNTTVVMSSWNLVPKISESTFSFVPPKGAQATEFLLLDLSGIYIHQGQPE